MQYWQIPVFLFFVLTVQAQTFNGRIEVKQYYVDGIAPAKQKIVLNTDTLDIASASDTLYFNYTVCGDTLVLEYDSPNGEQTKSIQFGMDNYLKMDGGHYLELNLPPAALARFERKDWKPASKKDKSRGFEYYAVDKQNKKWTYFSTVDASMKYTRQQELGGGFAALLHPIGINLKSGFRYGASEQIREHHIIYDDQQTCLEAIADFFLLASDEALTKQDLEQFMGKPTSSTILPQEERINIPLARFRNTKEQVVLIEDLKGKYTYIDVWASWCAPCRAEMPFQKKIKDKYAPKGLQVLSISLDKEVDKTKWLEAIEILEMDWENWIIYEGFDSVFCKELEIAGIPRYLLLDKEGEIMNSNAPRPSNAALEVLLDELFKNTSP